MNSKTCEELQCKINGPVTMHTNFEDMLRGCVHDFLPDVDDLQAAVEVYRKIPFYRANEEKNGVVGIPLEVLSERFGSDPLQAQAAASPQQSGATNVNAADALAMILNIGRDVTSSKRLKAQATDTLEVDAPRMKIKPEARAWSKAASWNAEQRRHTWPFPIDAKTWDLQPVIDHITSKTTEHTAQKYALSMHMLFGLIEFSEGGSLLGVIAGFYESGVLKKIFDLDIYSDGIPWSHALVTALCAMIDWAELEAKRNRYREVLRCVGLLKTDVVDKKSIKTTQGRGEKADEKAARDEESLEKIASVAQLKAGIHQSMVDMAALAWALKGQTEAPEKLRTAGLVAMSGVNFGNGHAGRPGEWSDMQEQLVKDRLAEDATYLAVRKHKTAKTSGVIGKFLAPGTRTTMTTYLGLPRSDKGLFFDPVRQKTAKVNMSWALRRWCGTYVPEAEAFTPTLLRKFFATTVDDAGEDGREIAKDIIARLNAHTRKTMDKHYVLKRAAHDAQKG